MDLKNTGKFIAEQRKAVSLTQAKLAEKLNISEKTVSKWETGKGFPDTSLILPLCDELNITSNELLSGKRLSDEEYKTKAEENLITLNRKLKNNKLVLGAEIYIIVINLILILFSSIFMEYSLLPFAVNLAFFIFSLVSFSVSIVFAVIIECRIGFYQCKHCGNKFIPSYKSFIFGPHMGFTRKLKCPHCGNRDWCKKIF